MPTSPVQRRRPRRDRRGRGVRGVLLPTTVPAWRSRSRQFDDLVLDSLERLPDRVRDEVAKIEFAVEDVPPADPSPWERGEVPLSRVFPADRGLPTRVVFTGAPSRRAASGTTLQSSSTASWSSRLRMRWVWLRTISTRASTSRAETAALRSRSSQGCGSTDSCTPGCAGAAGRTGVAARKPPASTSRPPCTSPARTVISAAAAPSARFSTAADSAAIASV